MVGSPSEKIDPAHWVSVGGATVMLAVVGLCSLSLWAPWWTKYTELPGVKETVEVSLWMRYTRSELAADDSTLNCDIQCDFTKIGSAKVREAKLPWDDACVEATGTLADNCTKVWVVRVFVLFVWFFGLLYAAFSGLNYFGAGLPASLRVPPGAKIALGVACVVFGTIAIVVAFLMEIRLAPQPPGTAPAYKTGRTDEIPDVVELNGIGFMCVMASSILSVVGTAVAYLSSVVFYHLEELANNPEQGRPLADVTLEKAPDLTHQIGAVHGFVAHQHVHTAEEDRPKHHHEHGTMADAFAIGGKPVAPPTVKKGAWMEARLAINAGVERPKSSEAKKEQPKLEV